MFILRFYYYIVGYYLIEIKGLIPEKIINLLNLNNISVWDIKKIDKTTITFKIMISEIKEAERISKKAHYILEIKKEYGKNNLLKALQKRKIFIFSVHYNVFLFIFYMGYRNNRMQKY